MENDNMICLISDAAELYEAVCRPVCQQYDMPQSALDILLFLANNPSMQMAKDIVKYRGLKRNLVSMHVERLVQAGYIEREDVSSDRRQKRLICTKKAEPVIEQGRQAQKAFGELILEGLSPQEREILAKTQMMIRENIQSAKKNLCG